MQYAGVKMLYLVCGCESASSHQILWDFVLGHARCHQSEKLEHIRLLSDQIIEMLPESLQETKTNVNLTLQVRMQRREKSRAIMSKVCTNFHYHIRYENSRLSAYLPAS